MAAIIVIILAVITATAITILTVIINSAYLARIQLEASHQLKQQPIE